MKGYARVSTGNGDQDVNVQVDELRAWAERLGVDVVAIYTDEASGTKDEAERPKLKEALREAHERRFDVLLVWALDRVSRGGIGATAGILDKLKRSGVAVRSYREPWLDTTAPGIGELLTAVFAWCAQQERQRIVERVRSGIERARRRGTKSGKAIGRPALELDPERARLAVERTGSLRRAAALLGVSAS